MPLRPLPLVALTALLLTSACATPSQSEAPTGTDNPRIVQETAYQLVEGLAQQAPAWVRSGPVLVATFVDVDQLEQSTTLGRTVTEQVTTRLVQLSFPVIEVKLRSSLFVKQDTGELLLSREIGQIAREQSARAVLVGTYAVGRRGVHLSARLIDPNSGQVLAAQDGLLPLDGHVKSLVR